LWAANRFRSDTFPHLLDDLLVAEQNGLPPGVCPELQIALGKIVNAATEFPDGSFWRSSVLGHVQKLEDLYREWNDVRGRRRKLNQMRKRRLKLSTAMRQNQEALAKQLDLKLMEAMFEALGDLTKALPSIFMKFSQGDRPIPRRGAIAYRKGALERRLTQRNWRWAQVAGGINAIVVQKGQEMIALFIEAIAHDFCVRFAAGRLQ
jgi:hypothetical protein